MEAGRELDALVAEKVMGWKVEHLKQGVANILRAQDSDDTWRIAPYFSTQISGAWQVVEKLRSMGINLIIQTRASCYVAIAQTWDFDNHSEKQLGSSVQDTAPLAICIAALEAVRDDGAERD